MDPHRKLWNANHQKLNKALNKGDRDTAIPLFLDQHAMVHSARVTRSKLWSFEDELVEGLGGQELRRIPEGGEHSIAWILLHLARIEDIVLNMLVAGTPQLFGRDHWAERMNVSILHSANGLDDRGMAELSASIDLEGLRDYRSAVARRTRQIVRGLEGRDFGRKVDPARSAQVLQAGAVTPEAVEIVHYWSGRTIAGLLLMPPTRHCILHLNEGMRIRGRLRRGK